MIPKPYWKEKHPFVIIVRKLSFLRFLKWPILFFFVSGSLNYSGFCFNELRYLSDDEKIRRVVNNINKGVYGVGGYFYNNALGRVDRYKKTIPYDSVNSFLKENPNCCLLVPKEARYGDDEPPSFLERVFGLYNYGVRIKYVEKYIEGPLDRNKIEGKGDMHKRVATGWFAAGNCGGPCARCGND